MSRSCVGSEKVQVLLGSLPFHSVNGTCGLEVVNELSTNIGKFAKMDSWITRHDFEIRYRKGALNKVANALSQFPLKDITGIHKVAKIRPCHRSDSVSGKDSLEVQSNWKEVWYGRMYRKWGEMQRALKITLFGMEGYKRKSLGKSSPSDDGTLTWKIWVSSDLQEAVLKENHDASMAGHLGIKKTIKWIQEHYY